MKMDFTENRKKLAGVVLATALVVGGFGSVAAYAANGNDAVPKDTLISVPEATTQQDTAADKQGEVQYSKDTYSRADGSQNFTMERWYNPKTKDMRSDLKEYTADHKLIRYQSTYYVIGGSDLTTIQRDQDGKPVSGTILTRTDQSVIFQKYDTMSFDFNSTKEWFRGGNWSSVGTETTADGKTLNKVMESYQSYIDDNTQANMQLIEFLDKSTGFPVKEELYEDSTGQYKLFSSDIMEYKYVSDDGSLFKTDGVTLTPATVKSNVK
jgi:hypothetical protein